MKRCYVALIPTMCSKPNVSLVPLERFVMSFFGNNAAEHCINWWLSNLSSDVKRKWTQSFQLNSFAVHRKVRGVRLSLDQRSRWKDKQARSRTRERGRGAEFHVLKHPNAKSSQTPSSRWNKESHWWSSRPLQPFIRNCDCGQAF